MDVKWLSSLENYNKGIGISNAVTCAIIDIICVFFAHRLSFWFMGLHTTNNVFWEQGQISMAIFSIFLVLFFLGFELYTIVIFPFWENIIIIFLSCLYTTIIDVVYHLWIGKEQPMIGSILLAGLLDVYKRQRIYRPIP